MSTILIVVLGVLCIGFLPIWPYSASWGYFPGGGLGFLCLVFAILTLMGRTGRSATVKP